MYALSQAFGEHGGSDYLIKFLIIVPPLGVLFFSVMPSLFLFKFREKNEVFFFGVVVFRSCHSCFIFLTHFNIYALVAITNTLCVWLKKQSKRKILYCVIKLKDDPDDELFSGRDFCYKGLSEDWNDISICNESSDSYGRCVINIAVNTNKQQFCDLIKISDEKTECYSMFNPSIGSCETNDYYCVAKKLKNGRIIHCVIN